MERRRKKLNDVEYEAPEVDEFGNVVQNTLLTKYDEEIQGGRKTTFRLGSGGVATTRDDMPEAVRKIARLRKLQNLDAPQVQLASEYYTEGEMVSFRKVKKTKKKGKKKKLTADDLGPLENESLVHLGSRQARQARIEAMQAENQSEEVENGVAVPPIARAHTLRDLLEEEEQVKMEVNKEEEVEAVENEEQDDVELQEAIGRSRRAKMTQTGQPSSERILQMLHSAKKEVVEPDDIDDPMEVDNKDKAGLTMTLNTTDEFCRTLGDLPTYGLSGNRVEDDQTILQLQQPKVTSLSDCCTSSLCIYFIDALIWKVKRGLEFGK